SACSIRSSSAWIGKTGRAILARMNRSPALLICGALLLAGCSKKETATANATNETASSGNPITAPVDYLGAVAKAKHHSEKVIDTASVNGAIQKFYAMEDRFPRDLDELVSQHYLHAV